MAENDEAASNKVKTGYPAPKKTTENIPEGIQLDNFIPATQVIVTTSIVHEASFYESLARYSRILKIMSILDSLVCILFYIGGLNFLIFLIALPLTGYCAARYYHRALITVYSVYLILIMICRTILIIVIQSFIYSIIQGLLIFMEICVFILTIKFYKSLGQISKLERKTLRMIGQGYIVPSANNSHIEP